MVEVIFEERFKHLFSKIKDSLTKEKIIKQISKIKDNLEIGKPMKYARKGTRELYVSSFRLFYMYNYANKLVYMLDIYHKDWQ